MGYGLGSDDLEEIAFYNKIKEEMKEDKENGHMGIIREDWCINSFLSIPSNLKNNQFDLGSRP